MPTETETETGGYQQAMPAMGSDGVCPGQRGGGYEIRTREGVNPTRFPSERHRPLGESSARNLTGPAQGDTNPSLIRSTQRAGTGRRR